MKQKNLYYAQVYGRSNRMKEFIYMLFYNLSSWPRLILEVFLRTYPGRRYFSFSAVCIITVLLCIYPFAAANMMASFQSSFDGPYSGMHGTDTSFFGVIGRNITIYLFAAAFFYFGLKRRSEVKKLTAGGYDFSHFSLSSGDVNQFFYGLTINGERPSIRRIETLYEPLLCWLIGFVLSLFGQSIGGVICGCAIVYSLSYCAAYHIGDNFIMDQIDERICSEELVNSFVHGFMSNNTRGFRARSSSKPIDPETGQNIVDSFFEGDFDDVK